MRRVGSASALDVLWLLLLTGGVGLLGGSGWVVGHSNPLAVPPHRTVPTGSLSAPSSPSRSPQGVSISRSPGPHAVPAASPPCGLLANRFSGLYEGPEPPPSLLPVREGACQLGLDEAGLGLASSSPSSASRTQLTIALPSTGATARSLEGFGVTLALSGISCSVGGVSYLTIDLVPPFGGTAGSTNANWSLWAPVWDLAPGGSCDVRCQNATALFTISGTNRTFCEDNILANGPGGNRTALGSFAPGDHLDLTLLGPAGGPVGLRVYVNDSTAPSHSLAWDLDGNSTELSGSVLRPFTSVSSANFAGWAPGPPLSVTAYLCPEHLPAGRCETYDGPSTLATPWPAVTGAYSWNTTAHGYVQPYPDLVPYSPSGGCSGAPSAYSCPGFSVEGGTGFYPTWGVAAAGGKSSLSIAAPSADLISGLGGPSQFDPSGGEGAELPAAAISAVQAASASSTISVTARVSAPGGFGTVRVTGFGCFVSTVPSTQTISLVEDSGVTNGTGDGNFSGTLTYSSSAHGPVYFVVSAQPNAAGPEASLRASVLHAAGGSACAYQNPIPPYFGPSNVTAIGGGYRLLFAENSSAVTNFTLTLRPTLGGATLTRNLTGTGPIDVIVGSGGGAYDLNLTAYDLAGDASAASAVVGPTTLPVLAAVLSPSNMSSYWTNATLGRFNLTISGGIAPYRYSVSFGDGSLTNGTASGTLANTTHTYAGYSGVPIATLRVEDAVGAFANATPVGVTVLGGAVGLNQSASAGQFDVGFTWSSAASVAPITRFTVFYTENASQAPYVTTAWPRNDSLDGLYEWNTTQLGWVATTLATGTAVYGIVVAWVGPKVGLTPDGWYQVPGAQTAPFVASSIGVTPSGGPAPLPVSLSTTVSSGTNASIDLAVYSFFQPSGPLLSANATVSGNSTFWWVNASATVNQSGTFEIVLHVSDQFGDFAIPVASFVVGPSLAPVASAAVLNGPALVGQRVFFAGSATGGSGQGFTYAWAFGDGALGAGSAPNHTYVAPGNYTVVLTVTDRGDGVNGTTLLALGVFALPTVTIRASATDASGLSYNFTASVRGGSGGVTDSWTFGDGQSATGSSVVHRFSSPGPYEVNVTATDSARRTATDRILIVVPGPSGGTGPGGLTTLQLVAFLFLAVVAALGVLGTAYYYSNRRIDSVPADDSDDEEEAGPPKGPAGPPVLDAGREESEGLPPGPERVRALPPPDPPNPS